MPITQGKSQGAELVVRTKLPPAGIERDEYAALHQSWSARYGISSPAAACRSCSIAAPLLRALVGVFAILGLILASLGIYGVISYSVTQRTQEIGIRMSLGATIGRVQRDVLGKTMRLALLGIALGAMLSLAVARLIASLLFATAPTDPATFAGVMLLLCAVAVLAGYIPARRASRIDPVIALRSNG